MFIGLGDTAALTGRFPWSSRDIRCHSVPGPTGAGRVSEGGVGGWGLCCRWDISTWLFSAASPVIPGPAAATNVRPDTNDH